MDIQLNGTAFSLPSACSLSELVERLGYAQKRVAIELNGTIIPKSLHVSTMISEADVIEIVVAVGGG